MYVYNIQPIIYVPYLHLELDPKPNATVDKVPVEVPVEEVPVEEVPVEVLSAEVLHEVPGTAASDMDVDGHSDLPSNGPNDNSSSDKLLAKCIVPAQLRPKPARCCAEPTGEMHEPACDTCRKKGITCEKDITSGACVSCFNQKVKCNYASVKGL